MNPAIWQVHKGWLIRTALVLTVTCVIDGAAVWFATEPRLWAVMIPCTLPLSIMLFVAIPMLNEEKRKSQAGAHPPG
jgi:hypothetical protein